MGTVTIIGIILAILLSQSGDSQTNKTVECKCEIIRNDEGDSLNCNNTEVEIGTCVCPEHLISTLRVVLEIILTVLIGLIVLVSMVKQMKYVFEKIQKIRLRSPGSGPVHQVALQLPEQVLVLGEDGD